MQQKELCWFPCKLVTGGVVEVCRAGWVGVGGQPTAAGPGTHREQEPRGPGEALRRPWLAGEWYSKAVSVATIITLATGTPSTIAFNSRRLFRRRVAATRLYRNDNTKELVMPGRLLPLRQLPARLPRGRASGWGSVRAQGQPSRGHGLGGVTVRYKTSIKGGSWKLLAT